MDLSTISNAVLVSAITEYTFSPSFSDTLKQYPYFEILVAHPFFDSHEAVSHSLTIGDFKLFRKLHNAFSIDIPSVIKLATKLRFGSVIYFLIKTLHSKKHLNILLLELAHTSNNDPFVFLAESRKPDLSYRSDSAFKTVCSLGNMQLVKYILQHSTPDITRALLRASRCGHLNVVKHLISNSDSIDYTYNRGCIFRNACKSGCLDIVKFFIEEIDVDFSPYVNEIIYNTAICGYLNIFRYLEKFVDLEFDVYVLPKIVERGHIAMFDYVLEKVGVSVLSAGLPIYIDNAISSGHLTFLEHLITKSSSAIDMARMKTVASDDMFLLAKVASGGHLNMWKFLTDGLAPFQLKRLASYAIKSESLDILIDIFDNCDVLFFTYEVKDLINEAAMRGNTRAFHY
jgi:hypothetical protein